VGVNELSVQIAREDWRNGERIVERVLADPARAVIAASVMRELQRELRRRLGQTYTLAALAALYGDVDHWGREAAQRVAPEIGWAHDGVFADAACARAARNARDWKPA
jgi:serine phosphatase RsbU (regulator of sigma subunit)